MIAKQSVYLNADRSKAVAEGDKDARYLLVREGHEVNDAELEKYDGAESLAGKAGKPEAARAESHPASNVPKQPAKPRKASKAKK